MVKSACTCNKPVLQYVILITLTTVTHLFGIFLQRNLFCIKLISPKKYATELSNTHLKKGDIDNSLCKRIVKTKQTKSGCTLQQVD